MREEIGYEGPSNVVWIGRKVSKLKGFGNCGGELGDGRIAYLFGETV